MEGRRGQQHLGLMSGLVLDPMDKILPILCFLVCQTGMTESQHLLGLPEHTHKKTPRIVPMMSGRAG